ncbi:MAG: hypothetical protein CM15mP116_08820 [Synechococcus sp.]|nr:MAG: hypothetical protein CM15mP116_08820 [Synechococcus sp.]
MCLTCLAKDFHYKMQMMTGRLHISTTETVSKTIWDNLNPHAIEWWKLLSLDNKDSLELPDLPGIEDLTRIIQLAEVIDQLKNHEVLIVVMPPPMHAIKLLQMSQKVLTSLKNSLNRS